MKAYALLRTASRTALVLLLLCSAAAPAFAQPADPAYATDRFETLVHTLAHPSTRATLTTEQWQTYSHQLTGALASGHDGLRQGALRMIIQYGDALQLGHAAVLDVVRIYRNHPNDNMRRMAVVALGQMHDAWAIDFLKRSARYEETPSVRHTILSVLDADGSVKLGPAKISR